MKAYDIFDRLMGLLFPPKCLLCSDTTSEKKSELCDSCLSRWSVLTDIKCPRCGNTASGCRCNSEQLGEVRYCGALFFYDGNMSELDDGRRLVYSLKRSSDRRYARFLAREMAAMLLRYAMAEGIDLHSALVTNAPRSRNAVREYGFDQAEELARYIARYIGAEYRPMFTNRKGSVQKNLSAAERKNNADVSIAITGSVAKGSTVILIDDVITTGATLTRCADLLRQGGASDVICAAAASVRSKCSVRDRHVMSECDDELWFKK